MSDYKVSPERNTEIQRQASEDAKNGEYNPPKGDMLVDITFSLVDLVTGSPSTSDIADVERPIYDAAHEQTKKD